MKSYLILGFVALVGAIMHSTSAVAEECKPLKLLNKIQMVRGDRGDGWSLPTTINGQEKILALGLGSPNSFLYRNAVNELKLPVQQSNATVSDMDGNVSKDIAKVKDFTFGYIQSSNHWFVVDPDPSAGADGGSGILSRDFLFGYDLDVDFGTGVLSLFAQDHCSDHVGYWVEPPPSTDVSLKDNKVTFPVTLDGHAFNAVAVLNDYSFMSQDVAEQVFGLSPSTAEQTPFPGSTKVPPVMGYMHTFANLSFGGVTAKNFRVFVVQDETGRLADRTQHTGNRAYSDSMSVKLPDLTIGMNVLKYLHINLAPRAGKLYVSGTSFVPEKVQTP